MFHKTLQDNQVIVLARQKPRLPGQLLVHVRSQAEDSDHFPVIQEKKN